MAFVLKPEDDKNLQQTTGQQTTVPQQMSSAPIENAAGGTQTAQGPTHSGNWTNLSAYLKNKPQIQQTAQGLVQDTSAKNQAATQAINQEQSRYQQAIAPDVTQAQKNQLEKFFDTTDNTALIQNAGNQALAKKTYEAIKAPIAATDINKGAYQSQYEAAKAANEASQRSLSEQLDARYGAHNTIGKKTLDTYAIQNDAAARGILDTAAQQGKTNQAALEAMVSKNVGLEQQQHNIAKNRTDYANYLKDQIAKTQSTIKKNADADRILIQQNLQNQRNVAEAAADAVRQGKKVTADQAKLLGIDANIYNNYLDTVAAGKESFIKNAVTDPKQYQLQNASNQLGLLNALEGVKPGTITDAMLNPGSAAYQTMINNYARDTSRTPQQAEQMLKDLMNMGAVQSSYYKDPDRVTISSDDAWRKHIQGMTPQQIQAAEAERAQQMHNNTNQPSLADIPTFMQYLTLNNNQPTNTANLASEQDVARQNALNAVFGVNGPKYDYVKPGTQYDYDLNQGKFAQDLFNYMQQKFSK